MAELCGWRERAHGDIDEMWGAVCKQIEFTQSVSCTGSVLL
jgi:hypothetical protein